MTIQSIQSDEMFARQLDAGFDELLSHSR